MRLFQNHSQNFDDLLPAQLKQKNIPHSVSVAHKRILIISSMLCCMLAGIVIRLTDLTLSTNDERIDSHFQNTTSPRADLQDRNGYVLATSLRTFSLYANPRVITNPKETAERLQKVFPNMTREKLYRRLTKEKSFVWIARHLTPTKHAQVLRLGIPGIYVQKDQRRVYPYGHLFSHVIGFTDIDNQGIAGLEKGLDQRILSSAEPVRLSVDIRLQHILLEELHNSIQMFQAKAGNGMIVNVKTGEILAMVSLPDFDPNQVSNTKSQNLFNRNTAGVYEFGSVLKIFTTAMALEKGSSLKRVYDASTPLSVGRFRITDLNGKKRPLTIQEAFLFSSNIATAKMALDIGSEYQKKFLKKIGFFDPISLELPELANPLIPSIWKESTSITASYGYGFSITTAHLIQGVITVLDGEKKPLTLLLQDEEPPTSLPILSQKTTHLMRYLMRSAVCDGQAKKGYVAHYEVGGKTGTANILEGGRYLQKNNLVTFVAALPISNPQYAFLVTLDRPRPSQLTYGYATAGWSAAPLAANVIRKAALILGLPTHEEKISKNVNQNLLWTASIVKQ